MKQWAHLKKQELILIACINTKPCGLNVIASIMDPDRLNTKTGSKCSCYKCYTHVSLQSPVVNGELYYPAECFSCGVKMILEWGNVKIRNPLNVLPPSPSMCALIRNSDSQLILQIHYDFSILIQLYIVFVFRVPFLDARDWFTNLQSCFGVNGPERLAKTGLKISSVCLHESKNCPN